MTAAQLEAVVKPTLSSCPAATSRAARGRIDASAVSPARVIPLAQRRAVAQDRVAKTLNGIWRGTVIGDKGDVHVDYFWIIDMQRNEALIIAQRSGKQSVTGPSQIANPPKLTYLMCAHEGYSPGSATPQIHEFVKVSNSTAGATQIVQRATGRKFSKAQSSLAGMWQNLVATGYFNHLPYVAYAGGFFKPIQMNAVPAAAGASEVSLKWDAQYRGGGATKLRYTRGVPMAGSERVQFVGASARAGDFLVASPGNGAFDQVSLGPLQQ
jgi:hypothetical protein